MNKNNIITVKNAEGDPDTQAEIIIQNKIDYIPKVSVIIPVYNVEEYLRECLDSVVNQTLKEIEIICVDDGSTDNSLEILKEYAQKDKRMTVIKQRNSGSGTARNCGINIAKGEFIAFMDSDDMYPKNKTLETMYTKAVENNVFICGGSVNQIKDGKLITDTSNFEEGYSFRQEGFVDYKNYQFDYGYWRFMYKNKFLKKYQLYFPSYLRGQDPPFFIKAMTLAEKFYALKEATYIYRISYKEIKWTERKVIDTIKCITDCLTLSSNHNLINLHINVAKRLCNNWFIRAFKLVENMQEGINHLNRMIDSLNYNIIFKEDPDFSLPWFYKSLSSLSKISIIIPVYNVKKYLSQCLDSVINQTYKNIEIICVNDGSTDGSLKILEEYAEKDNRIKILNQTNQGLANARNTGLKHSTGSYFTFLDSDDWLDLNFIENMLKIIVEKNGNIAKSGYLHIYQNGNIEEDTINHIINKREKENNELNPVENNIIACATFYKKSFMQTNNILYFDSDINKHEDILYTLKACFIAQKIIPVTNTYYNYRRSSSVLSKFNYEEVFIIPKIHDRAIFFLNSIQANKDDYIKAAQRIIWRTFDTYEKLCNFKEFKKDKFKFLFNTFKTLKKIKYKKSSFSAYINALKKLNKKYINKLFNSQKILLIELNTCHGECMPGYIKYFHDLGYKVNILLNEKQKSENPLCMFKDSVDITYLPENKLIQYINSNQLDNYDVCLFNSNIIYSQKSCSIFDLITTQYKKVKMLCVEHRLENIPTLIKSAIPIVLKKFDKNEDVFEVNTHYFGSFKDHNKNEITNFIIVGNIEGKRKNYNLLTSTVRKLHETNIKNFKITIVGKGNISDIPLEIQHYFDIKGRLSYPDMYHEMENADYFLTLLDPENPEHDRYLKLGTSGSFQLIYGFCMPCLIAEKFAEIHLLTQNNSIIYKTNNELYNSMLLAINQSNDDYSKIKRQIKETASILYKKSLTNLEKAIEKASYIYKNQINNSPLLFKDIGLGCNTWCKPKNVTGDDIKSFTYDLSDNIYTRYVSWDPIREGSCDVEIMRLSAIEKQSKRIVEFPINKIISSGEIINNKVEFHNQKGCWIGCKIEGTYESFSIEAKIKII